MDIQTAIEQLKEQGRAILILGAGYTTEEARWRPDGESWSVLEALNHLADEEVLDFRRYLAHILDIPDAPWPKIDPQGWVVEKEYNQQNPDDTLARFRSEREKSVAWLMELSQPDWSSKATPPWGGDITAGDMLSSWLTHDILHLRQLIELRYQITKSRCKPYDVGYAGEW
jgi:hypothetical protein